MKDNKTVEVAIAVWQDMMDELADASCLQRKLNILYAQLTANERAEYQGAIAALQRRRLEADAPILRAEAPHEHPERLIISEIGDTA